MSIISSDFPSIKQIERIPVNINRRITVDDPCYKVLQKALKNNGIEASWKDFALYIDYDNQERYIGPYEKILEVFRDLIRSGKDPEITIRSLKSCEDIPGDLYDGVVDS